MAGHDKSSGDFPAKLAAPARRALTGAGYNQLSDLTKATEDDIKNLHGVGPSGLSVLKDAMKEKGLSFKGG